MQLQHQVQQNIWQQLNTEGSLTELATARSESAKMLKENQHRTASHKIITENGRTQPWDYKKKWFNVNMNKDQTHRQSSIKCHTMISRIRLEGSFKNHGLTTLEIFLNLRFNSTLSKSYCNWWDESMSRNPKVCLKSVQILDIYETIMIPAVTEELLSFICNFCV